MYIILLGINIYKIVLINPNFFDLKNSLLQKYKKINVIIWTIATKRYAVKYDCPNNLNTTDKMGSYQEKDVVFLLRDISNFKIERNDLYY